MPEREEEPTLETALIAPPRRRALDDGPAVLVVNTKSRSGKKTFEEAREALTARGIPLLSSHAIAHPQRMKRLIDDALAHGAQRVLVGGGDGTVSCAVTHLLGRDVTLGVLPLGTGNDFARSLGIEELMAGCDIIARGYTARVDVGLANGRPFLNAASIGLATAIARRLTKRLKQRMGKLAYPVAAATQLWEHQPFRVRMKADTQAYELEVLQLVVGNGRYHGAGNMVAPDATLDDRRLHVYAITAPSAESGREGTGLGQLADVATLARVGLSLRRGHHVDHPAVTYLRTSRLYLETEPPEEVNADGELIGLTPMLFEIVPAALRVYALAPAEPTH